MSDLVSLSTDVPLPAWWARRRVLRADSVGYIAIDTRMTACADARLGYGWAQLNGPAVQCYGSSASFSSAADVTGTLVDGSTARFTRVADPDDAAKWCWQWRTNKDDPDDGTTSRRGEFSFDATGAKFSEQNACVAGLCLRMGDWRSTTDNQVVFQIHAPDASPVASPWLSFLVDDGIFKILLIYDANSTPSGGTTSNVYLYQNANWAPDSWMRFVIEAREDWQGDGVVRILLDGEQIVDYAGPVGYNNQAVGPSYVKAGYYHWLTGNAWDTSVATREVWNKGPYVATGEVSLQEMDDFLVYL